MVELVGSFQFKKGNFLKDIILFKVRPTYCEVAKMFFGILKSNKYKEIVQFENMLIGGNPSSELLN